MELPSPLFRQIADSIVTADDETVRGEAVQPPAELADGRSNPRLRASTHVAVYGWDEPAELGSVRVRDIGPGGLGIFQADRLALDQQLVVRLPMRGQESGLADGVSQSILMLCAVVYWEPLASNLYAIGLQFRQQLSEQELAERQRLLAAQIADAAQTAVAEASTGVLARISQALGRSRRVAS